MLTWKDTPLYNTPAVSSVPFGTLATNLRYPILSKLKDRLNQTWFQIRIGDRLAWVSSLDAQEDNGIPVLTYHHILRDEENTRFRHTSTTTSVRAFNNQMTWLRDQGYTTLTLYQLEGYVRNKINLPARAVVITFDDGLKSVNRYAYPVLKQYGFHATAFIISSRIKRHPQKWDPKSLQFMRVFLSSGRSRMFLIFSRIPTSCIGLTPAAGRFYSAAITIIFCLISPARAGRSASLIRMFSTFPYPFGGYNATAVQAANDAGFHMAVTTVRGR